MKKIRALEPQLLVLEALTYNQWVITMGQMLQATSMDLYIHCVNVASIAAHMALFGNRQMLNEQGISPISLVLGAFLHDRDVALPVVKIPSLCLIWNSWLLMNISVPVSNRSSIIRMTLLFWILYPCITNISMEQAIQMDAGQRISHLMSGSSPLPIPYALIWKIHSIRLLILRLCLWLSYWIICIMKQSVENTILHF